MSSRSSHDPKVLPGSPPNRVDARGCETARIPRATDTSPPDSTRTIKVLRKNNREEVHVRVMDLDGTSLIDLRVFEPDARRDYEPMPTRSGICLPRFHLRALIEALETAEGGVR